MTTTMKEPIIYAPVYIPNTPDCEYRYGEQKLSKEKIKYLSKTFLKYQNIDLQHDYPKRILAGKKPIQRGKLLKSYILQKETKLIGLDGKVRPYPEGTWIVAIKITDPLAMKLYYHGELSGVSATAKMRKHADFLQKYVSAKSTKKLVPRRILLSDIKDPVVFTISLVKKPCVYGAKFCNKSCIISNKEKLEENTMSLKDMIKEKLNLALDDVDLEKAFAESQKEDNEGEEGTEGNPVVPEDPPANTGEETPADPPVDPPANTGEETPADPPANTGNDETGSQTEQTPTEGEGDKGQTETIEGWDDDYVLDESKKSYVTKEEVSEIFKAGFSSIRDDLESFVEENINESITALHQSQKEALGYLTVDEAKTIFEEEFSSFKSDFEQSLKEKQEESIQQFSKTIETQTAPPTPQQQTTETSAGKLYEGRDAYGCRIR